MSKQAEAGKGSAPRKQQDHDAYARGWDAIFRRNRGETKTSEAYPAENPSRPEATQTKETR
jgi:hypothetical protein